MKIKQEKGFIGIDVTLAMIVVFIFMSILAVLFFDVKVTNKAAERQSEALTVATDIIETLKAKEYNEVALTQSVGEDGVEVQHDNNGYHYASLNGGTPVILSGLETIETGYTAYIKVQNYYPAGETSIQDIIKIITVNVKYKLANQVKNVTISTAIVKNQTV